MGQRLDVLKTYKMFVGGKFPRSESGRSLPVVGADGAVVAHACRASRKDFRDAVEAARGGFASWSGASAFNRGQVMYRIAEMMEGKRAELEGAIVLGSAGVGSAGVGSAGAGSGAGKAREKMTPAAARREVAEAIDRMVYFAGWADKVSHVLGSNNAVASGHSNFTHPEGTGVVAVMVGAGPSLLGLVSLLGPVLVGGNSAVVVACGGNVLPASVFGEVLATSDVPGGAVNVLTGVGDELVGEVAGHRDVDGVHAGGVSAEQARVLMGGAAENLKRVRVRGVSGTPGEAGWWRGAECLWWVEPFVEMKTIWHPAAT